MIVIAFGPVSSAVWALLGQCLAITGNRSVLLEWDSEIPEFNVVQREALRARAYRQAASAATDEHGRA